MPALAALVLWGCPAAAHDFGACVALDDDHARLACYDSLSGRTSRNSQAVVHDSVAPRHEVGAAALAESPPANGGAEFGLSKASKAPAVLVDGVLTARIAAVSGSDVGRWTVTLDNGQSWEQREAGTRSRRVKPGDEVRIEEASMGSYLLSVAGKGSHRVRRVK